MQMIKIFAFASAMALGAAPVLGGQITVTGQGSVESAPDMAMVRLGVSSEGETAAAALRENSEATRIVLERVTAAGVEARDVQTSGLSLSPIWNNRSSSSGNQPKIVGYMVNNQVSVRVREIAKTGQILDDVVKSGANNFNGLEFGLQDPGPATDEARKRAVAEAMRKAQLFADAAGVQLGEIVAISESGNSSPAPMMMREMAMSDAVPIAQGEVSMRASVNIIFEISE